MIEVLVAGFVAAVIAGVGTNFMVPITVRVAPAMRALDYPGGRHTHTEAVPRLGGFAVAVGLLFGVGTVALVKWGAWGARVAKTDLAALALGVAMVFVVGLVDDLIGVGVLHKFVVETVAAVLIVGVGWRFSTLGLPGRFDLDLGVLSTVVSVVWVVGVTNAVNLIDGLDGLAGGVIAIIAGSFMVYGAMQQNYFTVVLMGGIVGACMGFLRHNWAPAKVFMGDSGSLALGFLLAATSLHSSIKSPAAVAILVPVLALGLPVIDTLLVMAVRFLDSPKSHLLGRFFGMFLADRNHLHHLLQEWAGSRVRVVRMIYVFVVLSCGMALWVALAKSSSLAITLAVVEVVAIVAVRRLGLSARARQMSEEKRREIKASVEQSDERPVVGDR